MKTICPEQSRRIAITGGKGGVGKSTVSILLANKLRGEGKKVVLCDLDVECPNDYLLLGQELNKPVEKVNAQPPKLIKEKCTKCGLCVRNCRSNAIFQPKVEYPMFIHELCSGCALCWNLCPNQAIEVIQKVTGEIFVNRLTNPSVSIDSTLRVENRGSSVHPTLRVGKRCGKAWLVTGRSVGVVEETGPIVTETRKFAESFAKQVGADYLLLDTAPGMHCSVIRALINVNLAYCVTEPTPLGAHDLKLILGLLRKLKVPAKIVLNQADLGNRVSIDKIAMEFGVKIEHEIPHSRKLVEAYSGGTLGVTPLKGLPL